jgi:hypothetical protein
MCHTLTLPPHAARLHLKSFPVYDVIFPAAWVDERQREKLLLLVALFESALSEALLFM